MDSKTEIYLPILAEDEVSVLIKEQHTHTA